MLARAAVMGFAVALLLVGELFLNMLGEDRSDLACAAERETGTAEEGTRPRADQTKRSQPCRARRDQAAPYPRTPIGEERLRVLKRLHGESAAETALRAGYEGVIGAVAIDIAPGSSAAQILIDLKSRERSQPVF